MTIYHNLASRIGDSQFTSQLTAITTDQEANIKALWPAAPGDYISFLREVGHGLLLSGCLILFNSPTTADGHFDPIAAEQLKDVKLFGVSSSGVYFGFAGDAWRVVEIDPTTFDLYDIGKSFGEFIKDFIDTALCPE